MNVTYSLIYFLPGAGGNFLARTLNLLDDSHCFCDPDGNFPRNLDEKLNLLNYDAVIGKPYNQRNWKEFESKVKHHSKFHAPEILAPGSLSIWYSHPDLSLLDKNIAGPQDKMNLIYLDAQGLEYWTFVNALFKNSYIVGDWFMNATQVEKLPDLYRFKLDEMLDSETAFIKNYKKLANHLERDPDRRTLNAVGFLWTQWKSTVLKNSEIDDFKHKIGLRF